MTGTVAAFAVAAVPRGRVRRSLCRLRGVRMFLTVLSPGAARVRRDLPLPGAARRALVQRQDAVDPGAEEPGAGRPRRARRVRRAEPARAESPDRRRPLPELRRARRDVHLVPERELGPRAHPGRRPGDPDRPEPEAGSAAGRAGPPGQHLHPARQPLRHGRLRVGDAALPRAALRAPRTTRSPTGSRSLADDLEVVYGDLVLPKRLEARLPSVTNTWQNFSGAEHDDTAALTRTNLALQGAGDVNREIGRQMWQDQRFIWTSWVDGLAPSTKPTLYMMHAADAALPVALPARREAVRQLARDRRARLRRRHLDDRSLGRRAGLAAAPAAGRVHGPAARPAGREAKGRGDLEQGARHPHGRPRRVVHPGRAPPLR